ncbi:hypothetical protein HGRIS_006594 [Hohenbuehelia grisea]|uniref:P-loop containing nucleoside triphosphate hydrolase protein n=1 Tax=Hohenbuehelia grisea TaxID=104357 RepID=A0ABR3J9E0_9AGAR
MLCSRFSTSSKARPRTSPPRLKKPSQESHLLLRAAEFEWLQPNDPADHIVAGPVSAEEEAPTPQLENVFPGAPEQDFSPSTHPANTLSDTQTPTSSFPDQSYTLSVNDTPESSSTPTLQSAPSCEPDEQDVYTPAFRFDWRDRAPSRIIAQARARKGTSSAPDPDLFFGQRAQNHPKRFPPVNVGVQLGEPYFDAIEAYQDHFLPLLTAEQAEDEQVLNNRLSTWGLDRLKAEGYTLTDLTAYWLNANQFGRPVASFLLGPGLSLPDHRFDNGTQVLVSRFDPLKEEPQRGNVVSKTPSHIKVAFEDRFDLSDGIWRLDLGRSNIIFDRMRAAISAMHHDPSAQEATHPLGSDRQIILTGTYLRDILLRTFVPSTHPHAHVPLQAPDDVQYVSHDTLDHQARTDVDDLAAELQSFSDEATVSETTSAHTFIPAVDQRFWDGAFKDDMRIQSWARRYMRVDPVVVEGDPVLKGLNSTQIRAMAMMVGQRASLVQGPPGTGKTKTIVETIKLLKMHFEVPHPLLVCTFTNVAVDNLVEGLAASGLNPLRVGYGGKVKASLAEYTLDRQIDLHPSKPELDALSQKSKALEEELTSLLRRRRTHEMQYSGPRAAEIQRRMRWADSALRNRLHSTRNQMYALYHRILHDIMKQSDVICTTCISSACVALKAIDFPAVFLDEASMSTEPASLIPLMKGAEHVAFIGDHKQLPPVITSTEAQANGLGISLFERLAEEGVVPSIMLDTQYRMHPGISDFPSGEFYNFQLHDGTVDDSGNIVPYLSPPLSQHMPPRGVKLGRRLPVVFLDHPGSESTKDRSRVNMHEAHIVCSVVEDLLLQNPDLTGSDIGIITPYIAQVVLLTRLLNSDPKYVERFRSVLGDARLMQLGDIEVKTVDGFEGREKAVIVFSTVRNNNHGYIGFLADRRRLNVGLTRAKRGLFVIGNLGTLKAGKAMQREDGEGGARRMNQGVESWRRYASYLSDQELIVTLSGRSLNKALYSNLLNVKA